MKLRGEGSLEIIV